MQGPPHFSVLVMFLSIKEEICLERLERCSPHNRLKGWSVWSAAPDGEFTGEPTSLACDNILDADPITTLTLVWPKTKH